MPSEVPVLHYVLPENFTPAHRAQLCKSHKKIEQILGVTPSLQPIPISSYTHRHSKSTGNEITPRRTKTQARERGRLRNLFGFETSTVHTRKDTDVILYRVSTDSSSTSSSSSYLNHLSEPLTNESLGARRQPPPLKISCSNLGKQDDEKVLVVSTQRSKSQVDHDSPLSPLCKVDLSREKSRDSIIEEREWNKLVHGQFYNSTAI
jgi:hypothetical protein